MMPNQTLPRLSWSLCIATLNRPDVLERMLGLAMQQTRLPLQVIIVDASTDWEANRDRLVPIIEAKGVEAVYLESPKRSSAVQRNVALDRARGDIVFFLDDDTFLYSDCAERILEVYENDPAGRIAGVTAPNQARPPDAGTGTATAGLARKQSGMHDTAALRNRLWRWRLFRWVSRNPTSGSLSDIRAL